MVIICYKLCVSPALNLQLNLSTKKKKGKKCNTFKLKPLTHDEIESCTNESYTKFFCRRILYGINTIDVNVSPVVSLLFKQVRDYRQLQWNLVSSKSKGPGFFIRTKRSTYQKN